MISYRNRPCNHRMGTYPGTSALLPLKINNPDSSKPPPAAWPDPRVPQKLQQHPWASWHLGQPACSSCSCPHLGPQEVTGDNTEGLGRGTEGEHLHCTAVRSARDPSPHSLHWLPPTNCWCIRRQSYTRKVTHTTLCSIQ